METPFSSRRYIRTFGQHSGKAHKCTQTPHTELDTHTHNHTHTHSTPIFVYACSNVECSFHTNNSTYSINRMSFYVMWVFRHEVDQNCVIVFTSPNCCKRQGVPNDCFLLGDTKQRSALSIL